MKSKQVKNKAATRQKLWDPCKGLKPDHKEQALIDQIDSTLTAQDRRRLQRITQKIDRQFLQEKAELVRDTLLEVQRNRNKTPNTLLQRNVWSSLDVIGMELDRSGFTGWLKDVAPKVVDGLRLDNPELVDLEHRMMLDFLGVKERQAEKLGMPHDETKEVLKYAEKNRSGKCGLPYITSEKFSFREFFRDFCGRPDRILEIHHSPQSKATVAIVTGIVNIIGVFFGYVLTVLTVIVLIIVGCAGC
ncbi:MAG: hypothetical protein V1794_07875 [Candidatus Glassbacteria bacterium]